MDSVVYTAGTIISAVLTGGALVAWLALIVRRRRAPGQTSPLQSPQWFVGIFKQGLAIIRQNPLILAIPLAAVAVRYSESFFSTLLFLKGNPEISPYVFHAEPRVPGPFPTSLFDLPQSLVSDFFSAASKISIAALHGLRSFPVTTAFLLWAAFVLLKTRSENPDILAGGLTTKTRRWLGRFSALTGLFLLLVQVILWTVGLGRAWSWVMGPASLSYLLVWPFAYALVISTVDRADRGQALPSDSQFPLQEHFCPLLCFTLMSSAVGIVGHLPLIMLMFGDHVSTEHEILRRGTEVAMQIMFAMVSFIPIIAVVRRSSFRSAFDGCIELWARHAENASVLVVIGGLLLLFPVTQEGPSHIISGFDGWFRFATQFALAIIKVSLGAIILCSMVAFYKRIEEHQEELSSE